MLLADGILCVSEQAIMVRGCEERKSTILGLIRVPCVIRVLRVLGNSRTFHLRFFLDFRLDLDSLLPCQGWGREAGIHSS